MKEAIFDKLFDLKHKEDELQMILKTIDDSKAPHLERLNQLREEKAEVQDSIIESMEKENIKTYTYGMSNVVSSVRRTLGIVDEAKLMDIITTKTSKIAKTIGMSVRDIKEKSTIKVLNKPFAKEIADSWLKVEGTPMQGTEIRETKYLTIK